MFRKFLANPSKYIEQRRYALWAVYTIILGQTTGHHRTSVTPLYFALLVHAVAYETGCNHIMCPDGSSLEPIALLEVLLKMDNIQVNHIEGFHGCALQAASVSGTAEAVALLLSHNADPNLVCGYYGTALQAAIGRRFETVTRNTIIGQLLDAGAEVDLFGGENHSPLQAAANAEDLEMVKLMLENGASVNAVGGYHGTALQAAAYQGHFGIVKHLLHNSANPNLVGGHYGTALNAAIHSAASDPDQADPVVVCLLEAKASIHLQGGYFGNALQTVAATGNLYLAEHLLARGADINALGGDYPTPLTVAAYHGSTAMVALLLQYEADVNLQGGKWRDKNPLHEAALADRPDVMKLLLDHGAHINREDLRGQPLHAAAQQGNLDTLNLLLRHGADVNAIDIGPSASLRLKNGQYLDHFVIVL